MADSDWLTDAVKAMLDDPRAPTAPLQHLVADCCLLIWDAA